MSTTATARHRVPVARLRAAVGFKRLLTCCEPPRLRKGTTQYDLAKLLADAGRARIEPAGRRGCFPLFRVKLTERGAR